MMLRGAGFTVHDIGVDSSPEDFIDAVEEHEADIVGMSALLILLCLIWVQRLTLLRIWA